MRLLIICGIVLAIAGCGSNPTKIQTVSVDKPIVYCPAPPAVPTYESAVDKLTPADKNNPGVVGEAYKYDMTWLRANNRIYKMILDQYSKSSQNFDEVNSEISKLYNNSAINK